MASIQVQSVVCEENGRNRNTQREEGLKPSRVRVARPLVSDSRAEDGFLFLVFVNVGWSLLAHSQLCHALLALRMRELLGLVMLPLQRLLCHVATLVVMLTRSRTLQFFRKATCCTV